MAPTPQRREDFPPELLYSREKMWVAMTGPETARVGVALPAFAARWTPRVYFLELLPRGYLVAGRRCGGIDIEVGRLELVAPLSGRIARLNPAVVADPQLLLADPFGRGWLYELEKVAPHSGRALMDRDRFWALLRFERAARRGGRAPALAAEQRHVPELLWPEQLRLDYGGGTAVRARLLRRGRNRTFTPQWQPGWSWVVEYRYTQPSIAMAPAELAPDEEVVARWRYEVIELAASLDGVPCCLVRASELVEPPPNTHLFLYIGYEDFALRLVEVRSRFDPARRSLTVNDWGADSFVELRRPRDTIVDLPLFPLEDEDELRTVRVDGEPELVQSSRFLPGGQMEIAIEARLADGTPLVSEQLWERGLPWWRQARRLVGGREAIAGRLILES